MSIVVIRIDIVMIIVILCTSMLEVIGFNIIIILV